ncbi:MAG: HprK-related kinase A [Methylophilaceae bacterium]|nr:HprK-related kinase A [Methylophilaceae bacterium]
MKVSALTTAELELQLKQSGIFIQTGPFVTHLQTRIASVAQGVGLLYTDFSLLEQTDYADFHVSLERPHNLRRWFKPQVLFRFDSSPPFKPLPLDQALPMLEWGLNWCVSSHANRYLIIHAAVVEKDGYAAILPAPPGSGKSTLCAALVNRGWRLLSDELTLVRVDDGKLIPLPRPVSLKNQSIDVIQHYAPEAIFSPKVHDTIKGTVALMRPPTASVARALEPAQIAWVIFPKYQAGASTQLQLLPKSRTFMRVADNAFNYSLLGTKGFETLSNLIDAADCYDFTYSVLDEAIATFAALKPPTFNT